MYEDHTAIEIIEGEEVEVVISTLQRYFVEHDGQYHLIKDISISYNFVGESNSGKLIFDWSPNNEPLQFKYFDTIEKLTGTIKINAESDIVTVSRLTGDFISYYGDENTAQIIHIESGLRRSGIYGRVSIAPEVILTGTTGYDFSDGQIREFAIEGSFHDGETLTKLDGGTIVLSNGYLYSISESGIFTRLSDTLFSTSNEHKVHESDNSVLFGDSDYLVVKAINGLYVHDRKQSITTQVLDFLNILSVSYSLGVVYFRAEDDYGNIVNGSYTISSEELVYFSLEDNYNDIKPTQL